MIHCNYKILVVDFLVFKTKSYSFFIDEELCEVSVERKNNRFYYNFKIDNTVDTPLNRKRRKTERKHFFQALGFFGSLLFLIALLFVFLWRKEPQSLSDKAQLLDRVGLETTGVIFPVSGNQNKWKYSFVTGDSKVIHSEVELPLASSKREELALGMPLKRGDEFQVLYDPNNPSQNLMQLNQPSGLQKERYRKLVIEKIQEMNPSVNSSSATCQLDIAMELIGDEAFAAFYYNEQREGESYQKLIKETDYLDQIKEDCGK